MYWQYHGYLSQYSKLFDFFSESTWTETFYVLLGNLLALEYKYSWLLWLLHITEAILKDRKSLMMQHKTYYDFYVWNIRCEKKFKFRNVLNVCNSIKSKLYIQLYNTVLRQNIHRKTAYAIFGTNVFLWTNHIIWEIHFHTHAKKDWRSFLISSIFAEQKRKIYKPGTIRCFA